MKELEIKLIWENDTSFEMTSKQDAEDIISIIKVGENGDLATIWEHIERICYAYFTSKLTSVGDEMK